MNLFFYFSPYYLIRGKLSYHDQSSHHTFFFLEFTSISLYILSLSASSKESKHPSLKRTAPYKTPLHLSQKMTPALCCRATSILSSATIRRRLPLVGAFCIVSLGISNILPSLSSSSSLLKTGGAQSLPLPPLLRYTYNSPPLGFRKLCLLVKVLSSCFYFSGNDHAMCVTDRRRRKGQYSSIR